MSGWRWWFFAGYIAAQAIMLVTRIGKERVEITPGRAAIGLVEYGFVAWVVLS